MTCVNPEPKSYSVKKVACLLFVHATKNTLLYGTWPPLVKVWVFPASCCCLTFTMPGLNFTIDYFVSTGSGTHYNYGFLIKGKPQNTFESQSYHCLLETSKELLQVVQFA